VSGNAPQDEEVGQNVDHIDRLELASDTDRQAFMGELVEHVEHPVLASNRHDRKRVEMLFAHLKRIFRLTRLRLRGPRGAQDEFTLAAIAQNLRKLARLVARPPPLAAACVA
jgi:hypothetical protein